MVKKRHRRWPARAYDRHRGRPRQVRCRFCAERFDVWELNTRGRRRSWHFRARKHVRLYHPERAALLQRGRSPLAIVARIRTKNQGGIHVR